MSKTIQLPAYVDHDGKGGFKPGRGNAGWTLVACASVADRDAFMAAHPEAAMPCWRRFIPGVEAPTK
jgi:hypothetical protein